MIVVGGGAMGTATARNLAMRGRQHAAAGTLRPSGTRTAARAGPPGSSGSCTTVAGYARMAIAARPAWEELQDAAGEELLRITGGLDLGTAALSRAEVVESVGAPVVRLRPPGCTRTVARSPRARGSRHRAPAGRRRAPSSADRAGPGSAGRRCRRGRPGTDHGRHDRAGRGTVPRSSRTRARRARHPPWWCARGHGPGRCSRLRASTCRCDRAWSRPPTSGWSGTFGRLGRTGCGR